VREQVERLAGVLADEDDTAARDDLLGRSAEALERRDVLPGVVNALRQQRQG
jgi:hypothetical protein